MQAYIYILISYSLFHFIWWKIKNTDNLRRPISLVGPVRDDDLRIDNQRGLVGTPVLIAFIISLFTFDWLQVLLYTLAIRIGIFFLLKIIKSLLYFDILRRYTGLGLFFSKIAVFCCFLFFIYTIIF